MELLNVIGIETTHGFRTFELIHGDITALECDVLTLSAYCDGYVPVPKSVIGALQDKFGFSVIGALNDCEYDLREQFGIWISKEVTGLPFRRIVGVELIGKQTNYQQAMDNLFVAFSILEAKGNRIKSVAMPLLGAGLQNIDPDLIIPHIIDSAKNALLRSASLERIVFVEINEKRAQLINDSIVKVLGTKSITLPKKKLISSILSDINSLLKTAAECSTSPEKDFFTEASVTLRVERPRPIDIGITARRLAELVVEKLDNKKRQIDLYEKIQILQSKGVAPWIVGYLHTLRIVGNEVAHVRNSDTRSPSNLIDEDLVVCLFCIQRVLQFYLGIV